MNSVWKLQLSPSSEVAWLNNTTKPWSALVFSLHYRNGYHNQCLIIFFKNTERNIRRDTNQAQTDLQEEVDLSGPSIQGFRLKQARRSLRILSWYKIRILYWYIHLINSLQKFNSLNQTILKYSRTTRATQTVCSWSADLPQESKQQTTGVTKANSNEANNIQILTSRLT